MNIIELLNQINGQHFVQASDEPGDVTEFICDYDIVYNLRQYGFNEVYNVAGFISGELCNLQLDNIVAFVNKNNVILIDLNEI